MGIKHGKCKEYHHHYISKLIFEGEYLNRKENRKGKEYNSDGKLIFEGEYSQDYKKKRKGIC